MSIKKTFKSNRVIEGAGVHLKRAFGYNDLPLFDPFLMLDDFRNDEREKYIKGFPWHPHRGIETITYMLYGEVEHADSLGNKGVIGTGDVQWMTAGSGIVHHEMPIGSADGRMYGFQLWANLPKSHKMMKPRYQDVKSNEIPEVTTESGARIKIICGKINGVEGPVKDIITQPEYLDVTVPADASWTHSIPKDHRSFVYVFEGRGWFDEEKTKEFGNLDLILFTDGNTLQATAGKEGVRFLFLSGRPIGEPIAWGGPIVMNTEDELELAFEEYERGTFIK
ncbi:MAG: pirin family protein [Bacteroidota bacterium]